MKKIYFKNKYNEPCEVHGEIDGIIFVKQNIDDSKVTKLDASMITSIENV